MYILVCEVKWYSERRTLDIAVRRSHLNFKDRYWNIHWGSLKMNLMCFSKISARSLRCDIFVLEIKRRRLGYSSMSLQCYFKYES